jgi:hypothetical protein
VSRIDVAFAPAKPDDASVAVVIDVLRATTTIAYALAQGYERVLACGDIDQAQRLFVDAQNRYRDVSPFPLCWLYTQQGLMWMRAGNLPRARQLLGVQPKHNQPSDADANADEPPMLSFPCPCCGGRMIIIETFERGSTPRTRPTSPIRIDTS